jgi:hypothetical protein
VYFGDVSRTLNFPLFLFYALRLNFDIARS